MIQGIKLVDTVSSKHFEAMFYYATLGILLTNKKGEIMAINPFALKQFGYNEGELYLQRFDILIPRRYHKSHDKHHKNYITKPQTRVMGAGLDLFGIRKNGEEFPVEISLSNYLKDEDLYTMAFITDISERKKNEAEIEQLNAHLEKKVLLRTSVLQSTMEQLENSRRKLEEATFFQKAILDNAGAMIIATDPKGKINYFNPEASANLGFTAIEVVHFHSMLLFFNKEEIEAKRKELNEKYGFKNKEDYAVIVEKAKRGLHEEEQFSFIRKDGTVFPIMLSMTAIKNSKNAIIGFIGIAIDISERKKAEEFLKKALEKEKELGELKSRFVSMASHEFRTPLSTVLSSAYLVDKYTTTEDHPKREKHIQRIISSVNMLTDILNDFLSVGKIEEGKIQVRRVQFNLELHMQTIIEELKNNLKKGQTIQYNHSGPKEVLLDPGLLKHIVLNLISNAIKFSMEGSGIEITTSNKNDNISLTVTDHGIGISKEDQKHLMERFFRGSNAGTIQGTGLGLHLISKYAELMNGTVSYKSTLEKGTCFKINFKKN